MCYYNKITISTMATKHEQGFTLVELLLTIAVFAIVMPAIAVGINNLVVINNRARDLALINMLAQNKVEMLRSAGYNSIATGTTSFTSELPSSLASPKNASYTVTNSSPGIKEIVITIYYKDYSQTKTVNYKTIISEIGVGQ
jgi:prepilin-type N-terminal cleavage/methylation domain-containing protein